MTDRRTKMDPDHFIQQLVDVHYPDARKIMLAMDNLNTHTPASLYDAFPPARAGRLWGRLEIHYAPNRGSWLNIAGCQLSVHSRQSTKGRIPAKGDIAHAVSVRQTNRNSKQATIERQFTT